jgi:hypothetical protein
LAGRCLIAPCLRRLSECEGTGGGFMVSRGRAFGVGVVSACLGRSRRLPILLVISLSLMEGDGIGRGEGLMVGSKREVPVVRVRRLVRVW